MYLKILFLLGSVEHHLLKYDEYTAKSMKPVLYKNNLLLLTVYNLATSTAQKNRLEKRFIKTFVAILRFRF